MARAYRRRVGSLFVPHGGDAAAGAEHWVPTEQPSGWQRAVAAADFANGISAVVPFDGGATSINPTSRWACGGSRSASGSPWTR